MIDQHVRRVRRVYVKGTWAESPRTRESYDEIAVERLLLRQRGFRHTYADRAEALARIDVQNTQGRWVYSAKEIAIQLGCTARTVQRHRMWRRQEMDY